MSKTKMLAGLALVTGLAVAVTGVSVAQDAAATIAKRKAIMKEVGAAFKNANDMIKGDKPFDGKSAAEGLNKISAGWAEFAKLYPKGTETGGETTAGPKIWEDFKDFDAKGQALAKGAANAAAEAGKGLDQMKAAMGGVAVCKGCHDVYRVQKK